MYSGTFDAFRKTFVQEGFSGLYRGFWVSAFQLVSGVAYITTYETVRHALQNCGVQVTDGILWNCGVQVTDEILRNCGVHVTDEILWNCGVQVMIDAS